MLPFLKPKKADGFVIISSRKPDGSNEMTGTEGDLDPGLKAAAVDLIRAISSKDEEAVAEALKAAFDICDSMPHVEGEHVNEEDVEE